MPTSSAPTCAGWVLPYVPTGWEICCLLFLAPTRRRPRRPTSPLHTSAAAHLAFLESQQQRRWPSLLSCHKYRLPLRLFQHLSSAPSKFTRRHTLLCLA